MILSQKSSNIKEALICCIAIIALLFFDIIFFGASLLPSDMFNEIQVNPNPELSSILPHVDGRVITDGYSDIGAAAWQFEPAIRWMAGNIQGWQSPYWNPYSAAGSLGPETLVDSKLSVFSLLAALLGGGSSAFHFALLLLLLLSSLSLFLIIREKLEMNRTAAVSAVALFLLNGFSNTNLHAQMGLPYYLTPVLLLALISFGQTRNWRTFCCSVLAHALILSCTFLPVLLLLLCAAHLICLAILGGQQPSLAKLARTAALQALSALLGFLLLAPLYFPIIESFFVVDLFSTYNARTYYPLQISSFFSWFSAKHFWESYNGLKPANFDPSQHSSIFFHLGTVAVFFAAQGAALRQTHFPKLRWALLCLILVGFGRIFNFFPFGLIDYLPGFKVIYSLYWFALLTVAALFLAANGIHSALQGGFSLRAYLCFELLHWGSFLYLLLTLGWPEHGRLQFFVTLHLALSAALMALAAAVCFFPVQRRALVCAILCLGFCELIFYRNELRPYRYELTQNLPERVKFLKDNLKGYRLLNIGRNGSLYPEWGSALRIPEVSTMNSSLLPWYGRFYRENFGNDVVLWLALGWDEKRDPTINLAGLNLASVKYVMVQDFMQRYIEFFRRNRFPLKFKGNGVHIFQNKFKLPRAYLVHGLIESEQTPDRSGADITKFASSADPHFLERAKSLGISSNLPLQSPASEQIKFEEYNNASMRIKVKLASPGALVITDVWHPNWSVAVDGEADYIGLVNQAFRGVALPAGAHTVELSYKPATLNAAYCASFLTLVLLAALLAKPAWPRAMLP